MQLGYLFLFLMYLSKQDVGIVLLRGNLHQMLLFHVLHRVITMFKQKMGVLVHRAISHRRFFLEFALFLGLIMIVENSADFRV